jgi:phosphate transport system protein
MLRTAFERELRRLTEQILALGSVVENNLVEVIEVLRRRDGTGAQRLIAGDLEVNRKRIDIMNDVLVLIATQQPMAGDLRMIASTLEIVGELERINDYVKGIAKIALMIQGEPHHGLLGPLPRMAEKTREMLHQALEAYSSRDADLARAIPAGDDEVDVLFNEFYRGVVAYVIDKPDAVDLANHLEWAGHNLERAADRVTNICEWVVYNATGVFAEMDSELEAPPNEE